MTGRVVVNNGEARQATARSGVGTGAGARLQVFVGRRQLWSCSELSGSSRDVADRVMKGARRCNWTDLISFLLICFAQTDREQQQKQKQKRSPVEGQQKKREDQLHCRCVN